jgi:hypothetical protein
MIPEQFEQLVTAVFQIGGAAALSASLFTQRVPAGAATAWLNSPLAALGMLALLVGTTLLSPVFELKTEACWADYAKLATFGNRIFGFYGFMAFKNIEETAPDIRMYRQDILCRRKMKSENVFSTTSPIAKASWGLRRDLRRAGRRDLQAVSGRHLPFRLPEGLGRRVRRGTGHPVCQRRHRPVRRAHHPDCRHWQNAGQRRIFANRV